MDDTVLSSTEARVRIFLNTRTPPLIKVTPHNPTHKISTSQPPEHDTEHAICYEYDRFVQVKGKTSGRTLSLTCFSKYP